MIHTIKDGKQHKKHNRTTADESIVSHFVEWQKLHYLIVISMEWKERAAWFVKMVIANNNKPT